mgnify:CR=1 FL=1
MTHFLISVVIPIYNGEQDIPDLIQCLQAQSYPWEQVEYLFVDNGSQDQTGTLIEKYRENLATCGIEIKLFQENKIQSSYAARNRGIRAAAGKIIAFTDADCRPLPCWLAELIQPFSDPKVGIVAGEIIALPSENILEKYAESEKTLSQIHTLNHPFYPYGQTANLAIRRSILDQVGLFRPYLTTGGDADLCWRILRETSYQIKFADTAQVQHRHRSTLLELRKQWQRYGESNQYLHQLYGIPLMRELKPSELFYRLIRWLLKELPLTTWEFIVGKGNLLDLAKTPIGLINMSARTQGQRQAQLSEKAREIEWFSGE